MIGAGGKPPRGGLLVLIAGSSGESGEGCHQRTESLEGGPRPHCLPVNSDFLGNLLHLVASQRRDTEGKMRWRPGKRFVPDTLWWRCRRSGLGHMTMTSAPNLSSLSQLRLCLSASNTSDFCAEPRSSNFTAWPPWASPAGPSPAFSPPLLSTLNFF